MDQARISALSEQEAIQQIVETVQHAEQGTAPFVLVLGSGFSHGLVPTAREIVEVTLPLWMSSRGDGQPFDELLQSPPDQQRTIAQTFWERFIERNGQKHRLGFDLEKATRLPTNYAAAYRAAFDHRYSGALGEPGLARRFQRKVMRLEQPRLNAAHFLMASLLGVQPGRLRENKLFKARAAFCRLILTTNFDPFLQIALQAVNRLYVMSDTPELGVSDEIFDDDTDAIQLVYLHGSIHRRSQAATDPEIHALKEKNARTLAPVLKRHGIIVLGYSGWDDALVEALGACDRFDHRLYWCGLEPDPLRPQAFGPRVPEILRKPTANYVEITGAGHFFAALCSELVGLPRLIDNPIGQLREMLETVDLSELESASSIAHAGSDDPQPASPTRALVERQRAAIERLRQSEEAFGLVDPRVGAPESGAPGTVDLDLDEQGPARHPANRLLMLAYAPVALGDFEERIKIFTQHLDHGNLNAGEKAVALLERGLARYFSGDREAAQADWTRLIELPGAPAEQVAKALNNRGTTWAQKGETEKALADFTHVIEQLPGAPVERVAEALYNRGTAWAQKGETDKEVADYTRVIEHLLGAPVEQVAKALFNRGFRWWQKGETDKALADYTRLIEQLPGAPADQVAQALNNRAYTLSQREETWNALADYTRVIEQLPGAPVEQVAKALNNRGFVWDLKGETDKGLTDYTRVIERLPGVPVEQLAKALNNRGVLWAQKGDMDKALADYRQVIEHRPGMPVEQIAQALNNRGTSWAKKGETDTALADYSRVIEQLPGVPVAQMAQALFNRGTTWAQKGETDRSLADYTLLIEQLPGAPVDEVAQALNNRGATWRQKGEIDKALADYTRLIELPGVPAKYMAQALNNRGIAWVKDGKPDEAVADYTWVIERLPGAPVEQVAEALNRRGVAWGEKGETNKALADYTRVIEQLPGAPAEQVAQALAGRGWLEYQRNAFDLFLRDTQAAIRKDPTLDFAAFNLGLALLACDRDEEARVAYAQAAEKFPEGIESLAIPDLEQAEGAWLTRERAAIVRAVLGRDQAATG